MLKYINSKNDYDFIFLDKIKNSVAGLAYCSFDWRTNLQIYNSQCYLIKSFYKAKRSFDKVIVYTANKKDFDFASSLSDIDEVIFFDIKKSPMHAPYGEIYPIPLYSVIDLQKKSKDFEFVFYTEADSIFYISNIEILKILNSENYFIPHRIEKILNNFKKPDVWKHFPEIIFNDRKYMQKNYETPKNKKEKFFIPENYKSLYGGSWLCKSDFLKKIDFTPLENKCLVKIPFDHIAEAGGYYLKNYGTPLKSVNVFDLFIEHLSGFDCIINKIKEEFKKEIESSKMESNW